MRFLAALGMTVRIFGGGEGEAAIRQKRFQKTNYRSNRRFSLFNNILGCHSERSEESPEPFTITLKFD